MPWENTEQYIRSGHRDPEEFQRGTLKTITLNEKEGIKAIVGKPKHRRWKSFWNWEEGSLCLRTTCLA